ncbi:MAG: chemotaxis protein [Rhodospirillaceae bacterium]
MKHGSGSRRRAHAAEDLEEATGALLSQCMSAFHAFEELGELSEDMRILSLNAELAAGRAGRAGVAVRALTQYTRQLVGQLNRLRSDMDGLKSDTYGLSAAAMKALQELRLMHDAGAKAAAEQVIDQAAADDGRRAVDTAAQEAFQAAAERLHRMMAHADELGTHAKRIRQVAEQSAGISTNIAIEAAAAGPHEPEFRNVADTMKRYINGLRSMVDSADQAVNQAVETSRVLSVRLASARA